MTEKKKNAAMEDRTLPMPVQVPATVETPTPTPVPSVEPTVNRAPLDEEPEREGSAVGAAPAATVDPLGTPSFDDEVERRRAPPARPARESRSPKGAPPDVVEPLEPTEAAAPIPPGSTPAEVFASQASFVRVGAQNTEPPPPAEPTQAVLPERPREQQPVGLPLSTGFLEASPSVRPVDPDEPTQAANDVAAAPTAPHLEEYVEVAITAPMSVAALRAATVPTGMAAHRTTTEEEPAPLGIAPAEKPPAAGTPTLELPASTVAPDDPTRLKLERPRSRRRGAWIAAGMALAAAGLAAGVAMRGWPTRPTATSPTNVIATQTPETSAAAKPPPPTVVAKPPPPPDVVAPAPLPPAPPPDVVAAAPPAADVAAVAPGPAIPPALPEPVARERPPPRLERAPDGFGPFLDRSGAGVGASLAAGVRAALGDALAGSTVGVRGELRRTSSAAGVASAECGLLVFDEQGQRATVRGASRVEEAGAPRPSLLRRAAEACARGVEAELRAAVAHAKGPRG